MNNVRVKYKSVGLTYEDLVEFLLSKGIAICPSAGIHLATYTPVLEGMARIEAGYISKGSELVMTTISESE